MQDWQVYQKCQSHTKMGSACNEHRASGCRGKKKKTIATDLIKTVIWNDSPGLRVRALRSDGDHGCDGPNKIYNYNGLGYNVTEGFDGDCGEKK